MSSNRGRKTGDGRRETNCKSRATDTALADVTCEDCEYSIGVKGESAPILTCRNKADFVGRLCIVDPDHNCANFTKDKELLAPHLVQALAEGAKLIPLTQGQFAIVDAADYAELGQYKWCVFKTPYTFYAVRATKRNRVKGKRPKRKTILMHRAITGAPKGLLVDHRNHNGLDNRKQNLRLCTKTENTRNQLPRRGCSSQYKGVSWKKRDKKFAAQITCKGKKIYLGYFDDEIEAAKAYDKKARELFGEYACLNFPDPATVPQT